MCGSNLHLRLDLIALVIQSIYGYLNVSDVQRYSGHEEDGNYFQLLYSEGAYLLLGARNVVYNLSALTLQEHWRIKWGAENSAQLTCKFKRRTLSECQNYIKVIVRISENELYLCGTNAFTPRCRNCIFQSNGNCTFTSAPEDGFGKVPPDPSYNNSAMYTHNQLYTATMTGSNQGSPDAVIYSEPIVTVQGNSEWLNVPSFVAAIDYEDKVYFFFREVAAEHINCGKAVLSRVARVCKNDKGGGRRILQDTFTSFFKARLNCSLPGEYPFYFDEIQSASEVGQGNYMSSLSLDNTTDMVYAVFNTPINGVTGSAVCAYRMSDIQQSFGGSFKGRESPTSIWLPVRQDHVPAPHPAMSCANDSTTLPDASLAFISQYPLMNAAVAVYGGRPVFVETNQHYRLSQVAAHWQVRAADSRHYDVLFLGTDNGRVLKVVNVGRSSSIETVVIEDLLVFADRSAVVSMKLLMGEDAVRGGQKLIVMSRNEVVAVPLQRCRQKISCSECVALQDPYCVWSDGKCTNHNEGIQSIETGSHEGCIAVSPQECRSGYYGDRCQQRCPANCNGPCHESSGKCGSCKDGFYGDDCGKDCNQQCPAKCEESTNSTETGAIKSDVRTGTDTAGVVGGVVGGILSVALVAGIIWYILLRHKRSSMPENNTVSPSSCFPQQCNKGQDSQHVLEST